MVIFIRFLSLFFVLGSIPITVKPSRASELEDISEFILTACRREGLPAAGSVEGAKESHRLSRLKSATGKRNQRDTQSTYEDNALWDIDMLGTAYLTGRPNSSYSVTAVDKEGRVLHYFSDYEGDWNTISPHPRGSQESFLFDGQEGFPLSVAIRSFRSNLTVPRVVVRLPDGVSESARARIAQDENSRESSRDQKSVVFFRRNFNAREANTLAQINTQALAEARRILAMPPSPSPEQRAIDRQRLAELERIQSIDIPPQADPSLTYTGIGAPPLAKSVALHPMEGDPALYHYAYSLPLRGLVRLYVDRRSDGTRSIEVQTLSTPVHYFTYSEHEFQRTKKDLWVANREIDG